MFKFFFCTLCWALLQLFHYYYYYNENNHDGGISQGMPVLNTRNMPPTFSLLKETTQSCSTFVNRNLSVVFLEETGLRMCSLPSWKRITVGSCLDQVLQSIPNLRHTSVWMNESSFIMCIKHFTEQGLGRHAHCKKHNKFSTHTRKGESLATTTSNETHTPSCLDHIYRKPTPHSHIHVAAQ